MKPAYLIGDLHGKIDVLDAVENHEMSYILPESCACSGFSSSFLYARRVMDATREREKPMNPKETISYRIEYKYDVCEEWHPFKRTEELDDAKLLLECSMDTPGCEWRIVRLREVTTVVAEVV